MMLNRLNSAPGNQAEDQKPSFVPFAILNGVLAALVLASIIVGIVLIMKSNDSAVLIVASLFYWIGLFVDLSAVTIGFIAVAKTNAASIVVFLSVSAWQLVAQAPIVLISVICWIVWITATSSITMGIGNQSTTYDGAPENIKILVSFVIIFSLARIIISVVIFFIGLNLYGKVQRIDNTSRGRIIGPARLLMNRTANGSQTQGNSAQNSAV